MQRSRGKSLSATLGGGGKGILNMTGPISLTKLIGEEGGQS